MKTLKKLGHIFTQMFLGFVQLILIACVLVAGMLVGSFYFLSTEFQ